MLCCVPCDPFGRFIIYIGCYVFCFYFSMASVLCCHCILHVRATYLTPQPCFCNLFLILSVQLIVGGERTKDAKELLYVRQKLVLVAKAFQLQAIDLVHIDYKGLFIIYGVYQQLNTSINAIIKSSFNLLSEFLYLQISAARDGST